MSRDRLGWTLLRGRQPACTFSETIVVVRIRLSGELMENTFCNHKYLLIYLKDIHYLLIIPSPNLFSPSLFLCDYLSMSVCLIPPTPCALLGQASPAARKPHRKPPLSLVTRPPLRTDRTTDASLRHLRPPTTRTHTRPCTDCAHYTQRWSFHPRSEDKKLTCSPENAIALLLVFLFLPFISFLSARGWLGK